MTHDPILLACLAVLIAANLFALWRTGDLRRSNRVLQDVLDTPRVETREPVQVANPEGREDA